MIKGIAKEEGFFKGQLVKSEQVIVFDDDETIPQWVRVTSRPKKQQQVSTPTLELKNENNEEQQQVSTPVLTEELDDLKLKKLDDLITKGADKGVYLEISDLTVDEQISKWEEVLDVKGV